MQNTGVKKRAAQEDVDSAYLFVNAKKGKRIPSGNAVQAAAA